MTEAERAYIAGIFDGEGCVSHREYSNGPPHLSITQKDRELLEWIQQKTGVGNIYTQRDYWQYHVGNRRDIQRFIRIIYPYSMVKRAALKKAYYHKYGSVIQ